MLIIALLGSISLANAAVMSNNSSDHHRNERATFHSGMVSQRCLQCMCDLESRCQAIGCHIDEGTDSCGYFQIKEAYWTDCGKPGGSWRTCADNLDCASRCVQQYMKRYVSHSGCTPDCETFARLHNGGPSGCRHKSWTNVYWHNLKSRGCDAHS